MKFEYFNCGICRYPVGAYFHKNLDYIKESANGIMKLYPSGLKIALVCRGTSGCILASGVGFILEEHGYRVTLVISRKENESHHSETMCNASTLGADTIIVVIDDFISSGATIQKILEDLDASWSRRKTYDLLCISNAFDEPRITHDTNPTTIDAIARFDTILCNNPN